MKSNKKTRILFLVVGILILLTALIEIVISVNSPLPLKIFEKSFLPNVNLLNKQTTDIPLIANGVIALFSLVALVFSIILFIKKSSRNSIISTITLSFSSIFAFSSFILSVISVLLNLETIKMLDLGLTKIFSDTPILNIVRASPSYDFIRLGLLGIITFVTAILSFVKLGKTIVDDAPKQEKTNSKTSSDFSSDSQHEPVAPQPVEPAAPVASAASTSAPAADDKPKILKYGVVGGNAMNGFRVYFDKKNTTGKILVYKMDMSHVKLSGFVKVKLQPDTDNTLCTPAYVSENRL
jgi:hypothetical protein